MVDSIVSSVWQWCTDEYVRHRPMSLYDILRHFHSDGGAELVAADVLTFLHKSGVTTSHSPRVHPTGKFHHRALGPFLKKEKVLCMLLRSSLPVAFWWLAVECAAYFLNRLPTKTVLGYMSPYECVYGAAPDLKWIRIWS